MITRYSSRLEPLDKRFLIPRLEGAKSYDRVAGFFSSSILEVAGEQLEAVEGKVRVVCNSHLDPRDTVTNQAAQAALRQEWCAAEPEELGLGTKGRFARLYELLASGKLEVRVLPDSVFGLVHGKAGVIVKRDGTPTSFMGSTNETFYGFRLNYELIWEDDSPEAVAWVQKEFDALWNHHQAIPLPEYVAVDAGRIANRVVIPSVEEWRQNPDAGSLVLEAPVYRQEVGLWEHQKYFVALAFKEHQTSQGARFVLADMVGLGKTIQLALSAELMALISDQPILIITPKGLQQQWQDEMKNLLDLPSAVWDGRQWIDEEGLRYPPVGDAGILECPRRLGIVSAGLITYSYGNPEKSSAANLLLQSSYECVIVDEAHHARRQNIGQTHENEKRQPNNLLAFLLSISNKTRSILLATATPVQLHAIEAYDLLSILGEGNNTSVLGNRASLWRKDPFRTLRVIQGTAPPPEDEMELWQLMTNPLPPASENIDFRILRKLLHADQETWWVPPSRWVELKQPDRDIVRKAAPALFASHNPYIRHIIRRTRSYLETEINPETHEPYLDKIEVRLHGDAESDAILLPVYLEEAYTLAGEFCRSLAKRAKGSGFLKTLLLRRVGSTLVAGRATAIKILGRDFEDDDYLESESESEAQRSAILEEMTDEERELLHRFVTILNEHEGADPKYQRVKELLVDKKWLDRGCIVFSQYYDSIQWLAEMLKEDLKNETIGLYSGTLSGVFEQGQFRRVSREDIKSSIGAGEIRLLLGTDAASEGLNLQRLGCLINLDLPWNPTRLEQRKGRIQRIGQIYDEIWIYNMRYRNSVEDRVHDVLSQRFEEINKLFGQIPDVLEDVWINVALDDIEDAKKTIDRVPKSHPFELRYDKIEPTDWESSTRVLDSVDRKKVLLRGW